VSPPNRIPPDQAAADREDPVSADVANSLKIAIDTLSYPHDLYPRQWFPDLDGVLTKLFSEMWLSDPAFRKNLSAAGEARVAELIAAELGLPSLLAKHPRALLLIYRQMISGFVRRLHRCQDEWPDIVQEIYTRLLSGKLAQIQKKYDSSFGLTPSFTSYFMVCVRNMYIDVVREGRNLRMKGSEVPFPVVGSDAPSTAQSVQTAFLDEEFAKLRVILQLHPASRGKIMLCLKLKCRLPVIAADVRRCFPGCSAQDILQLSADFRSSKDRDMYRAIVSVFNRHEARPVQADTLRKWVETKIHLLISHLNRLHRQDVYDDENISDLIALFFTGENEHAQG
jgi:DNA-directed RNA polymerase specialized sigma24 family protein